MPKFVKFTNALIPVSDAPPTQDVFINPDFVRVVSTDAYGGTLIQMAGEQISVREDVAKVIKALS